MFKGHCERGRVSCMGTVDGDPVCPTAYHAYVGSKAAWFEITDQLEQFDTDPPE